MVLWYAGLLTVVCMLASVHGALTGNSNKRLVNGPSPWEGYVEEYDGQRYRPFCYDKDLKYLLAEATELTCRSNGFMATEDVNWISDLGLMAPENANDRMSPACPDTKFVYLQCKRGIEIRILLDVSESLTHKAQQKWMKEERNILDALFTYMTSKQGSMVVDEVDLVSFTPFTTKLLLEEQVGFSPGYYGDMKKLTDGEKAQMKRFKDGIAKRTPKGLTDIGGSLKEMAEALDNVHYKKAVIFIASDFVNMKDDTNPVDVVASLTKDSVSVYPIIFDTKHRDDSLFEAIRDASLNQKGFEATEFHSQTIIDLFDTEIIVV